MYSKTEIRNKSRNCDDKELRGMLNQLERLQYSFVPQILDLVSKHYDWKTNYKFPHTAKAKLNPTFWKRAKEFIEKVVIYDGEMWNEKLFLIEQCEKMIDGKEEKTIKCA